MDRRQTAVPFLLNSDRYYTDNEKDCKLTLLLTFNSSFMQKMRSIFCINFAFDI
jgi:hypothetical protein